MAQTLEIISALIAVAGTLLVAFKNKIGFLVWVIGNLLWVSYGALTKQYFFMSQYIIFTVISAFGFIKWLKEDLKSDKSKAKIKKWNLKKKTKKK